MKTKLSAAEKNERTGAAEDVVVWASLRWSGTLDRFALDRFAGNDWTILTRRATLTSQTSQYRKEAS